jgi:Ras-related protein Rab-8A
MRPLKSPDWKAKKEHTCLSGSNDRQQKKSRVASVKTPAGFARTAILLWNINRNEIVVMSESQSAEPDGTEQVPHSDAGVPAPATSNSVVPTLISGSAVLNAPFDVFVKLLLIGNSGTRNRGFVRCSNLATDSLLVGPQKNTGVGKSSMLLRFADDAFNETYINTIGIDFKTRLVDLEGKRVKLQIWDTAGQERFQSLQTIYYRGAMGIVLVFDITDEKSFTSMRNWMKAVQQYALPSVLLMLVGNKADRPRMIAREEAEALAAEFSIPYVETSAKMGSGVTDAFLSITRRIMSSSTVAADTAAAAAARGPSVVLDPSAPTPAAKTSRKPACCQH